MLFVIVNICTASCAETSVFARLGRRMMLVVSSRDEVRIRARGLSLCVSIVIKRKKGTWWMPWHREAMKDVAPCDKLWEGGSNR